MASFSILVTSSPYSSQNAYSAYRFAQAIVNSSHTLAGVFFYCDGTHNANRLSAFPSDEFNLAQSWAALKIQYQVPLLLCVTAALKRGVINEQDAKELDLDSHNLHAAFDSIGLGEFAMLQDQTDRLVQF
jgi:tRNA 2-thiouridine synthesizing protein D